MGHEIYGCRICRTVTTAVICGNSKNGLNTKLQSIAMSATFSCQPLTMSRLGVINSSPKIVSSRWPQLLSARERTFCGLRFDEIIVILNERNRNRKRPKYLPKYQRIFCKFKASCQAQWGMRCQHIAVVSTTLSSPNICLLYTSPSPRD